MTAKTTRPAGKHRVRRIEFGDSFVRKGVGMVFDLTCPWCHTSQQATKAVLNGHGKRCGCGAMLGGGPVAGPVAGYATTTAPQPALTVPEIDTQGVFYGVKIAPVGHEDDDWSTFLAFTSDRRRALAAANAMWRQLDGSRAAVAYTDLVVTATTAWVRVFDNCGCGLECRCGDDPRDPDELAEHEPCAENGFDHLPPCGDRFDWITSPATESDPDAVAVYRVVFE